MKFDRSVAEAELAAGRPALVWSELISDTETPISAGLKLIEPGRGDFILESVEGGSVRGRYSLIGLAPDLVFRADAEKAEINRNWALSRDAFEEIEAETLPALRALVSEFHFAVPEGFPAALSCFVGYFSYETVGLVERLNRPPANPLALPDMIFVRPTVILIFDRLSDRLTIASPIWTIGSQTADAAVDQALAQIDSVAARLSQPLTMQTPFPNSIDTQIAPAIAPSRYAEMVRRAQRYIEAGDIFQVVLAQRFTHDFPLPPLELYRALRRINPSPFLYFLDFADFALVGSSPEILVRVRDGEVTIRPIAGTRPRGMTASEDEANRHSLLADPKERAEHLMLLDLGRNDVGRVAQSGSVRVTDSYSVEFYSHVMHIVSNVVGTLDAKHDAIDALMAGFPAGTVSGAPKVRACEVIAELEPETRGAYAGGVGYFSPSGDLDSCIVLRTAVVKDGKMHVQAGAGIVADSIAANEQRECEAKAGALLAAAKEAIAIAASPKFGQ